MKTTSNQPLYSKSYCVLVEFPSGARIWLDFNDAMSVDKQVTRIGIAGCMFTPGKKGQAPSWVPFEEPVSVEEWQRRRDANSDDN